jgi:hypothetical protein
METLEEIIALMELFKKDTLSVFKYGNYRASIRARKNLQKIKELTPKMRKIIRDELPNHDRNN